MQLSGIELGFSCEIILSLFESLVILRFVMLKVVEIDSVSYNHKLYLL